MYSERTSRVCFVFFRVRQPLLRATNDDPDGARCTRAGVIGLKDLVRFESLGSEMIDYCCPPAFVRGTIQTPTFQHAAANAFFGAVVKR